jgi:CO dehydrogenase maturation factor
MKIVVTMGRGGTGKTSFVAMMARALIGAGATPLLLVDVDPDQNLGEMVGVDLEARGKRTISELLDETFLQRGGTTVGIAPSERIESRIWEQGIYEDRDFDFLAVGTKWIEGCYCLPDAALKSALSSLLKNYRYVLIDSPAGLEHLNRRITGKVDDIFDVIGPSRKSFAHVQRAFRVLREVGISFSHFYGVGGYLFPEELEQDVQNIPFLTYLGRIAFDPRVGEAGIAGRSLLDLPEDSPGYSSVRAILERAGYL